MAIGGDVFIRVKPETLVEKSQEVSESIRKMAACFDELERIINRTSYYWIGEAGDMHRRLYQEQKDNVDEIMRRLKEHPADLLTIAQNYMHTEQAVEEVANQLDGDVIE